MKYRARFTALTSAAPAVVAAALFASACTTTIGGDSGGDGNNGTSGTTGTSGSSGASGASGASGSAGTDAGGTGGTSGVGGTGGTGGTGGGDVACKGTHVTTQKRLVRLSENQLVNTYAALFGAPATTAIVMTEDIPPATNRAFPPLGGETAIGDNRFALMDRMAQGAMAHVEANFATLTNCGPTDAACGEQAMLSFAEKAFRRPLTPDETASLQQLWGQLVTDGAPVTDAVKYAYFAILIAPEFAYRTEFGGDWNTDGPLDPYEIANEIAYFVTDGPPDAELLGAAAAKVAGAQPFTPDEVRGHVTRLLATPQARANLEAAMVAYFQLTTVPGIVIDSTAVPNIELTSGILNSMYREGELFFANTLWQGTLADLVTSRRTWVNSQIAMPIYGVAVSTPDVNTFVPIDLPADRSGILTLSPFLTSKSRPTGTSVVGRGLAVNAALVCAANPPFPEGNEAIEEAIAEQSTWTEKQKADYRADAAGPGALCYGCHSQFDAMGLVLENYDAIGRYRTMDPRGNVIDAAWTTSLLPEQFDMDTNGDMVPDQVTVSTPAQLAQALVQSGALDECMAMNLINFALADVTQGSATLNAPDIPTNSCAVRDVVNRFSTTDRSFTSLIREIAASDTLAIRTRGM